MSENKNSSFSTWKDPDDAPALTEAWFEQADVYSGVKLVRSGKRGVLQPKVAVTISCDQDVVEAFQATGAGWQARMNGALRDWLREHNPA